MTFGLLTKSYSEIYGGRVGIQKLTEDQLFGAKIKITVIEQAADGSRTRTERTWYQYRWVDVVDANQSVIQRGDTAAFMKTLADGTGNFIQQKLILSHIPAGVTTSFETAAGPFNVNDPDSGPGRYVAWQFDPATPGGYSQPVTST